VIHFRPFLDAYLELVDAHVEEKVATQTQQRQNSGRRGWKCHECDGLLFLKTRAYLKHREKVHGKRECFSRVSKQCNICIANTYAHVRTSWWSSLFYLFLLNTPTDLLSPTRVHAQLRRPFILRIRASFGCG